MRKYPTSKKASGSHKLPPLPYGYDALEPYISEKTLRFHHTKHHQGYVDGLNKAEKGLDEARESEDEKLINAHTEDLAFNWGGHYLHTLYWRSLSPTPIVMPEQLRNLIKKDFGSIEKFGFNFKEVAKGVKGSGWAVLVLRHSTMGAAKLEILGIKNHENHVLWKSHVLLPIDVWEHAYYLDSQNDRGGHFDKIFDNLVAWDKVEERLTEAMANQIATQKLSSQRVASLYLARGKAKKDVGHGGLDEWFSGHGSGKNKNDGEATWGDWVSISPVDKTIEKEDGTKKKIQKGDIVGECGISKDPEWKDLTNNGKSPLKCMPRQKAHKMDKKERAELAKGKQKAEKGSKGKKPVNTPTFKKDEK